MYIAAALGLLIATRVPAQEADGTTELTQLDRLVWNGIAGEVATLQNREDANGLLNSFLEVAAFSILEGLDLQNLRTLKAYRYVAETARTDKQIGSTSTARGTTSLLEKPGIAEILGFAIEHGAIQQEKSGTDLTLRSSPAVLYRILYRGKGLRTVEDEKAYAWLSRVGLSATLPTDDSQSKDGQNFDLDTVTEWSVQLNLNFWGDRTVHSTKFVEKWQQEIGPAIDGRLKTATKLLKTTIEGTETPQSGSVEDQIERERIAKLRERIVATRHVVTQIGETFAQTADVERYRGVDFTNMGSDEAIARLSDDPGAQKLFQDVKAALEAGLVLPIRRGEIVFPAGTRQRLEGILAELADKHAALAAIKKDLDTELADVLAVPMFTVEYTNHKAVANSNYSEAKLLFQYRADLTSLVIFPEPFDLILNANASFFHNPDEALGQETVRDYGVSLAAEFRFENPFAGYVSEGDHSPITAQISGRVARLESDDDEAGFVQGKVEVPLAAGLTLPLSITYATRSEDIDEDEVRGNVGFTFDTDKLYALAKLAFLK